MVHVGPCEGGWGVAHLQKGTAKCEQKPAGHSLSYSFCPKKPEVRDFVSFVPRLIVKTGHFFSNQVLPLAFKSLLELKLFTRARAKIKNHFFLKLKNAKHFNSSVWSPKHYVFNQDKN